MVSEWGGPITRTHGGGQMDTPKGRDAQPKTPTQRPRPDRSLPRLLDRIRRDARERAEDFLAETEVPSEGE